MADAAKLHVRENKFKVGAHVSVSRQYFIEDASDSDARFYGHVVRVLSNDDVRVKWVIDGTQSVVDPKELRVETQDIVDIETFKPAPHVDFGVDDENKESKIKVKIEGRKSSRKRNNICYAEEEDTEGECSNTQKPKEEGEDLKRTKKKKIEEKLVTVRESKRNVNTNNINNINANNINENICVNDVLDALEMNNNWLGADLFLTPPEGNGSDEDSGDDEEVPQFHQLSKKQLLASCELQVVTYDEDDVRVISSKKELSHLDKDCNSSSETDDSFTSNVWEKIKENEKQIHLREKVNSFVPPRNRVIDDMDCNDHNWSHIRLFELFFDDELLDQIVYMTNTYAVEQSAVGWNSIDNSTLRAFIGILILSGYNQLPSYKMYWEEASDVQQPLVRDALPRN